MYIFVAGASGVIGVRLVPLLVATNTTSPNEHVRPARSLR